MVLKTFQEYERLTTDRISKGRKKKQYLKKPVGRVLSFRKERVMAMISNSPKIPSIQNLSMLI
jgi:hypothetical protein